MKQNLFIILFIFFLVSCKLPVIPVSIDIPGKSHKISEVETYMKKGEVWYNRGCFTRSLKNFFKAHEIFSGEDNFEFSNSKAYVRDEKI